MHSLQHINNLPHAACHRGEARHKSKTTESSCPELVAGPSSTPPSSGVSGIILSASQKSAPDKSMSSTSINCVETYFDRNRANDTKDISVRFGKVRHMLLWSMRIVAFQLRECLDDCLECHQINYVR
jgi:hypothetical protein